jgi:hypothetical protein
VPSVSSDRDDFLDGIIGYASEPLLTTVIENQSDSLFEVFQTLFLGVSLPVGARELRTEGDEPFSILLDHSCELVCQLAILPRSLSQILKSCPKFLLRAFPGSLLPHHLERNLDGPADAIRRLFELDPELV